MNSTQIRSRSRAFTLVEMLVVVAIMGILASFLLPALAGAKARARRIQCLNNLRETGIAFHLFANDHNGKFPMNISTNDGGALEYVDAAYQCSGHFYFAYRFFLPLAAELNSPKLLICPMDLQRSPATNFYEFSNWNLSYVIGIKADPGNPGAILAGDRGFPGSIFYNSSLFQVPPPKGYQNRWQRLLHQDKGNILFTDGHVEESSDALISSEETETADLVNPDVKNLPAAINPYASYVGGNKTPVSQHTEKLVIPQVLAETAHESLHATQWLLWLLLLFLILLLFARWLDRHIRYKQYVREQLEKERERRAFFRD